MKNRLEILHIFILSKMGYAIIIEKSGLVELEIHEKLNRFFTLKFRRANYVLYKNYF